MYANTVGSLDIDMQVDSLIMLTAIENRLEELIEQEETLQGSTVREAQKELEKLRRQHAREEKQRQVEQKHKERAQRAKERSNQVFLKVHSPSGVPRPEFTLVLTLYSARTKIGSKIETTTYESQKRSQTSY